VTQGGQYPANSADTVIPGTFRHKLAEANGLGGARGLTEGQSLSRDPALGNGAPSWLLPQVALLPFAAHGFEPPQLGAEPEIVAYEIDMAQNKDYCGENRLCIALREYL
jgi:hypothetical protein